MPGQADDAHVVAEVAAAELRADAEVAGQLQHLGLQLDVPEAVRQSSSPTVGRLSRYLAEAELGGLEGVLGAECRR